MEAGYDRDAKETIYVSVPDGVDEQVWNRGAKITSEGIQSILMIAGKDFKEQSDFWENVAGALEKITPGNIIGAALEDIAKRIGPFLITAGALWLGVYLFIKGKNK